MLDENYKDKKQEIRVNNNAKLDEKAEWKKHFTINPDMTTYGNNEAQIYDFGIFNKEGKPEAVVDNNDEVTIKLKVQFNKDIECTDRLLQYLMIFFYLKFIIKAVNIINYIFICYTNPFWFSSRT